MESIDDYVSTKQAGEMAGLSQRHIDYLARNGIVKARRVGAYWLVYLPSLKQYLASNPRPGIKLGTKLPRRKKNH